MIATTIDKKEKSITVETDFDFAEFKIEKFREYFHLDFQIDKLNSSGCALFFNQFGGRKYYPKELIINNIEGRIINISYSEIRNKNEIWSILKKSVNELKDKQFSRNDLNKVLLKNKLPKEGFYQAHQYFNRLWTLKYLFYVFSNDEFIVLKDLEEIKNFTQIKSIKKP